MSETVFNALAIIREYPYVRRSDVIFSLEIGKSAVDRALKKLKDAGYIERVGPKKTGYWKLLR